MQLSFFPAHEVSIITGMIAEINVEVEALYKVSGMVDYDGNDLKLSEEIYPLMIRYEPSYDEFRYITAPDGNPDKKGEWSTSLGTFYDRTTDQVDRWYSVAFPEMNQHRLDVIRFQLFEMIRDSERRYQLVESF